MSNNHNNSAFKALKHGSSRALDEVSFCSERWSKWDIDATWDVASVKTKQEEDKLRKLIMGGKNKPCMGHTTELDIISRGRERSGVNCTLYRACETLYFLQKLKAVSRSCNQEYGLGRWGVTSLTFPTASLSVTPVCSNMGTWIIPLWGKEATRDNFWRKMATHLYATVDSNNLFDWREVAR